MTKLNELKEALQAVQQRMKSEGKAALKEAFVEFFEKHPEIGAIVWTQYTPYFNDGEPCEFGVHSFEFKFNEPDEEYDYEYGDDCAVSKLKNVEYNASNRRYYPAEQLRELTPQERALIKDGDELEKTCHSLEDLLKLVLGEGKVVAQRSGSFEVHDYDHD